MRQATCYATIMDTAAWMFVGTIWTLVWFFVGVLVGEGLSDS